MSLTPQKRTARQAGVANYFIINRAFARSEATKRPKLECTSKTGEIENSEIVTPITSTKSSTEKVSSGKLSSDQSDKQIDLQNLITFKSPLSSVKLYEELFRDIANAFLNHTVLRVK